MWNQARAVARARWSPAMPRSSGRRCASMGSRAWSNQRRMMIGEKVRLDSTAATLELVTERNGVLDVEDHVFLNFGCNIAAIETHPHRRYSLLGPYCMSEWTTRITASNRNAEVNVRRSELIIAIERVARSHHRLAAASPIRSKAHVLACRERRDEGSFHPHLRAPVDRHATIRSFDGHAVMVRCRGRGWRRRG